MKRTINHIVALSLTILITVSCSSGASLQRYFVDNQETKNFISQDIPLSMIEIDKSAFSEEQKEAYNSVSKLNFLGYKADENNAEEYKAEIETVKAILSDSKYKDLMEFSDKGNKVSVKYLGDDDEADEVILFGSSNDMGFAVIRILGNDMSPDKMVTLVTAMQTANVDENQIQDIMNFFK